MSLNEAVPEKLHKVNPNVDKYKVISNRLNDELSEIDKQIVIVQHQLDELNQQRSNKLEEISFNDLTIQNIMHHENPSLGYLSFDSIEILLSYLDKSYNEDLYCVNKHFRAYKLSVYYYKLTRAKSIDFYFNNNGFRDNLLKSVANPSQQISLQYINNVHVTDTSCLASVHSILMKGCSKVIDVSSLGNIHYLDLTGTKGFTDVSALTNVHTLILDDCSAKLKSIGNFYNMRVFTLKSNKHINDISSLVNCEELVISHCRNISEIPMLENLKIVKLEDTRVIDFNSLNNNSKLKILEILKCTNVFFQDTMFENFTNLELLHICSCHSVGEIKNLRHVEKLVIERCSGVTKIDGINYVKGELKIEDCSNLSAITNINNVEGELKIVSLNNLQTLSNISNVNSLFLNYTLLLTNIEHVTGVSNVKLHAVHSLSNLTFLLGNPLIKLELSDCQLLIDISNSGFCPDVTLQRCNGILDISSLVNCQRVVIIDCRGVTDVSSLGNVHDLTIFYGKRWEWENVQHHVTGVSGLGNVHTLTLCGLDITDTDIATLGTVKSMELSRCDSIVDVSPLVTLEKLKLYSMRNVVNVSMLRGMKDFIFL